MKLSKEELKKKIDEVVADEDLKISLLEDIEDSMEVSDESEKVEKTAYDEVVAKYEELKTKYKERFLKGDEESAEEEKDVEEVKEEEVVDVKEI
jgi:hypothetical protein